MNVTKEEIKMTIIINEVLEEEVEMNEEPFSFLEWLGDWLLKQRQNKNDLGWSKTKSILKLARFFPHRLGEWKRAAILKLIMLSTKRCRS